MLKRRHYRLIIKFDPSAVVIAGLLLSDLTTLTATNEAEVVASIEGSSVTKDSVQLV